MFGSFKKRVERPEPILKLPRVDENLVEVGGELNVPNLLRAYQSGAFPWTVNPVTWWSPDPRAVIEFTRLHVPKSLLKLLRKGLFSVTINRNFNAVIDACAEWTPNRRSTWITHEFTHAYKELHRGGHAHSLEVWQEGRLVGGIYGVAIGGYFAGESMFHRVSNASKAALCFLAQHLHGRGYTLFDVQMPTQVTLQMGATLIPRTEFLQRLREAQGREVSFGDTYSEAAGKD